MPVQRAEESQGGVSPSILAVCSFSNLLLNEWYCLSKEKVFLRQHIRGQRINNSSAELITSFNDMEITALCWFFWWCQVPTFLAKFSVNNCIGVPTKGQ